MEIFLFQFVSFDAYKTIKVIEISCIKAFAYSEDIKRMLYCWKKKKFVPEERGRLNYQTSGYVLHYKNGI